MSVAAAIAAHWDTSIDRITRLNDEQLLTGDSRIMIGMPFRPSESMTFGMYDVLEPQECPDDQ